MLFIKSAGLVAVRLYLTLRMVALKLRVKPVYFLPVPVANFFHVKEMF